MTVCVYVSSTWNRVTQNKAAILLLFCLLLSCCCCQVYWKYYSTAAAAAAKSLQSCPTLCDPIDGSPPGSAVLGILQARTLEWVAISFSNAWKWKVKGKSLSRIRLLATPRTAAHQAPPSMGFSRQEYWSGVPSQHSRKTQAVPCGVLRFIPPVGQLTCRLDRLPKSKGFNVSVRTYVSDFLIPG